MSTENWLPLTDYSNKYKVSISTLRRRLKAGQVRFKYEEGKYSLLDIPLQDHDQLVASLTNHKVNQRPHQSSGDHSGQGSGQAVIQPTKSQNWNRVTNAPPQMVTGHPDDPAPPTHPEISRHDISQLEGSIQKVLGELKKAYTLILQEKEEQIILLKDEVTDLRTLVQVLESENDRLKINSRDSAPIDSWLNDIDALEK